MRIGRNSIAEGERIPFGYREVYFNYLTCESIVYPIGIHWIVRGWRKILWLTYWSNPDKLEQLERKIHFQYTERIRHKNAALRRTCRFFLRIKPIFDQETQDEIQRLIDDLEETENL